MYSTCCKWLFTDFLFFRQNFSKSRLCTPFAASGWLYVLHILQVANFWIFFFSLSELFQVPPTYSTCCKWLFTNFLFFRQNFSKSPLCTPLAASGWSYVLHILQVDNFWKNFFSLSELFQVPPMYSTYCKWLLSTFLFFGQNFSKSPLFTPLAASGCWTKNSFLQSLFFYSIVLTYVVEVNFPLYCVMGT